MNFFKKKKKKKNTGRHGILSFIGGEKYRI